MTLPRATPKNAQLVKTWQPVRGEEIEIEIERFLHVRVCSAVREQQRQSSGDAASVWIKIEGRGGPGGNVGGGQNRGFRQQFCDFHVGEVLLQVNSTV